MRVAVVLIVIAAAGAAGAAKAAGPEAKAGLWERTVTRQMEGPPVSPVADPSRLPPEQRARIEQMLSVRTTSAPTTTVARYCVTAEAVKMWETFSREERDETNCRRSVEAESSRALKVTLVCDGGKQTGSADFTAGSDRVQGTIALTTQEPKGQRTVRIEMDSRWLSADCGEVKAGAPLRVKG